MNIVSFLGPLLSVLTTYWFISTPTNGAPEPSKHHKTKVVVKKPIVDPWVNMTIDLKHVLGTYYDKTFNSSLYPESQRKLDIKIYDVIADFGLNIANDYVGKGGYLIAIGPKYISKLTSLIARYLPEWRAVSKSNNLSIAKSNFMVDTYSIWYDIRKNWTVKAELRAKTLPYVPKNPQEFMKKFKEFVDNYRYVVRNNPCGFYLHWAHLTLDKKRPAELGSPFVIYLQERGHDAAVSVLDTLIGMFALIKPAT